MRVAWAPVLAAMGPAAAKGSGEQSLARTLYPRLENGWLLLADRLFYGWDDWCAAADSGADLLWRVRDELRLPCLELLPDGSYRVPHVVMKASLRGARRDGIVEAARRGEDLDPALARHVRVVEYEVTDRDSEDALITLVTTITGWQAAPAAALAGPTKVAATNAQFKTVLRGPGRILRSGGPELVRQEIWGYLLTAWAVSALISDAAAAAWIDPAGRKLPGPSIVRRAVGACPRRADALLARAMAEMTRKDINPVRHRSAPRRQTLASDQIPRQAARPQDRPPQRAAHDQTPQPANAPAQGPDRHKLNGIGAAVGPVPQPPAASPP